MVSLTETLDLIDGTRTATLDLSALPFLSRLGPNKGTLSIVMDESYRVQDLQVSVLSPRRLVLRELERLGSEADWAVSVDDLKGTTTPRFKVDLELAPRGKQRLAETEVRLEGASIERIGMLLRPLLHDRHYRIAQVREA